MPRANEDLAVAMVVVSVAIGAGVGFIVHGISHNDEVSVGIGLLCSVATFIFICKLMKIKPPTF